MNKENGPDPFSAAKNASATLCSGKRPFASLALMHPSLMCPVLIVTTQAEDRSSGKATTVKTRAQAEKRKQKKLNIDEAEGKDSCPLSLFPSLYTNYHLNNLNAWLHVLLNQFEMADHANANAPQQT